MTCDISPGRYLQNNAPRCIGTSSCTPRNYNRFEKRNVGRSLSCSLSPQRNHIGAVKEGEIIYWKKKVLESEGQKIAGTENRTETIFQIFLPHPDPLPKSEGTKASPTPPISYHSFGNAPVQTHLNSAR